MDALVGFRVNSELSRKEFVRRLVRNSTHDELEDLWGALFLEALEKDLANKGDMLVMRRKSGAGKTKKEKHAEDAWTLVGAIQV